MLKTIVNWILAIFRIRSSSEEVTQTEHAQTEPQPAAQAGDQTRQEGAGDLYHRKYSVRIVDAELTADQLMRKMKQDLNLFVPAAMATFDQPDRPMQKGDQIDIHITGPWNGPVRVSEVLPKSFTFVTRDGHLEAGHIRFSICDESGDANRLLFRIESWARSRDWLVRFTYEDLSITKLAQTNMWAYFCQSVVSHSGGTIDGNIEISTKRIIDDSSES